MSKTQEVDPALEKLRGMTLAEIEKLIPEEDAESSRPYLDAAQDRNMHEGVARIKQGALPIIQLQQSQPRQSRKGTSILALDSNRFGGLLSLIKNHRSKLIFLFFILGTLLIQQTIEFSSATWIVLIITTFIWYGLFSKGRNT